MAKLIGTGTNQVPTNGMLGGMAFQTPEDVTVKKIQEEGYNVVTQTDIGTAPNQIPLNQFLGGLAYMDSVAGLDFSATSSASAGTVTSQILDDYEEGTWTPIFSTNTGGASGQTYSAQRGRYTKIGRIVHCSFDMQLSTKGTFSGNYITIGGLPYVNMEGGNAGGTITIGYYTGFSLPANSSTITAYINTNQVYLMTPGDSAGSDYLTVTDATTQMSSSSRLIGQMTLFLTS